MLGIFRTLLGSLFGRGQTPTPSRKLADEQQSEFFTWFSLEPDGEPVQSAVRTTHTFRPSGPAFHSLVRLDIVTTAKTEAIGEVRLWVARPFIDGSSGAFARDIVASFLSWALKNESARAKDVLIANIGNMRAANQRVIMRADAAPPEPADDTTGGYAVFMGQRDKANIAVGRMLVEAENVLDAGQRWLTLHVAPR
jgi:hypothetical protein